MRTGALLVAAMTAGTLLAQGPPRMGREFGMAMGHRGNGEGRVVTGAPFSAVEVTLTQQTLAGGNLIQHQEQTTISRDSQGRVRTESTVQRPNAQAMTRVTVTDPVAGVRRAIDPQNRTVSEMALRAPVGGSPGAGRQRQPRQRTSTDPNVVSEDLGAQTLNGVVANGKRITRTIPAGTIGNLAPLQIVEETWTSPELQRPVLVKITDPRSGVTVRQLTNINRAEPDAALFQAPPGFTVRQAPVRRGGPGGALQ